MYQNRFQIYLNNFLQFPICQKLLIYNFAAKDQLQSSKISLSILIYGILYFLVHDVLIHRRFKWFDNVKNPYFRALRKAHKIHHKHLGKEDGECFGMLYVPTKYFKEAFNSPR